MALYNLVCSVTPTLGLNDLVVGVAVAGYNNWSGVPNGAVVSYGIRERNAQGVLTQSEAGLGTWNAGTSTISRDTVRSSTNGGAKINLTTGIAEVFITAHAEDFDHTRLLNIGTNTHAQIDSHIGSTSNPHSVTAAQTGAPTLVSPSVTDNFVSFSNLLGGQKDSGSKASDFATSGHGHAQLHDALTLGTANGLSLATQALSLGLASAGVTGALSGTDWSTFNSKQPAGAYLTSVVADSPLSGAGTAASHLVVDLSGRQPLDADLTAIAALGFTSTAFLKKTAADTWALDTATYEPTITILPASKGGTGINNASATLTLPNLAITLGGGGAAQTYTLPAAGGTFALLNAANVFTEVQKINVNSALALLVEQDGVKDNVLVVDATNGRVGINMIPANPLDVTGKAKILYNSTSPTAGEIGVFVSTTWTPSGDGAGGMYGMSITHTIAGGATAIGGAPLIGIVMSAYLNNTTNALNIYGGDFAAYKQSNGGNNQTITGGRFQAYVSGTVSGTGTILNAAYTRVQNNTALAVGAGTGLLVATPVNNGGGSFTTVYGIQIQAQTIGATNYAIYTNAGLNRFGDQIEIVGAVDRNQLKVTGFTTQTLPVGYLIDNTAATAVIRDVLKLETQSTGTAAASLGAGLLFSIETATASTMQSAGRVYSEWVVATNASRAAKTSVTAFDSGGERIGFQVEGSGTEPKIGFYAVATIARAVLATGAGATVDQVITALQNLGLVKQA